MEEVYCSAVRGFGSHGTWEPSQWLWPGSCGHFRRGVFTREGWLDPHEWEYKVFPAASAPQIVKTDGILEAKASVEVSASDPLDALSASVGLSYGVGRANEVLVLTHPGRWWEIENIEELLERIRAVFEEWPLSKTVICAVFETSGGVIGVSSRSTTSFEVSLDIKGRPTIVPMAGGGVRSRLSVGRSARRAFPLWPKDDGPEPGLEAGPEERRLRLYTPLFSKGYRVSKHLLGHFGRRELVTLDGNPVTGRIARADPVDLLYEPGSADVSIDEIREMPIDELFEEVTPEILTNEVAIEIASELPAEEIDQELTLEALSHVGVESLDFVSVVHRDRWRLDQLRQREEAGVVYTEGDVAMANSDVERAEEETVAEGEDETAPAG